LFHVARAGNFRRHGLPFRAAGGRLKRVRSDRVASVLHVAQISFFNDLQDRTPEELLVAWPSLIDIAECAAHGGLRVSVIQASRHSYRETRNDVGYYFLPFGRATPANGMSAGLATLLTELAPDVFHVQGLGFPQDVGALARFAPDTPIVLQDHADRVPRFWRKSSWRRAFAAATGVAFCSSEQSRPFVTAGLLGPRTRVYEIPESTSRFTPGDVEQARREMQVGGDPLLVWVGHLDANKDPLTVLEGVSRAAQTVPGLRLWCCFGTAPLLEPVRRRIETDPLLRSRVHLMGSLPHEKVEQLMRAADVFVLGSHREGSGYSLLEALACGVTPVVTDIPSFRTLTAQGTVGALWPVGDPDGLCRTLLAVVLRMQPQARTAVRAHFDRELSFNAVGSKWATLYTDVLRPEGHDAGKLSATARP
jgi:glycosyltransferase involved in cell wall biosynthesis